MEKITFLGPFGGTFSHMANDILATKYEGPVAVEENCLLADNNNQVLEMVSKHGGYGALAMETLADRRIIQTLDTFIELMDKYDTKSCPTHVAGAVRMELHFALMARPGTSLETITQVVAHEKAKGPCKGYLSQNNITLKHEGVGSNGEAARRVAEDSEYANWGALAPASAAQKYGLQILNPACEDSKAITTFFYLAPRSHRVYTGENNRMLIAFKTKHRPGGLVRALLPFRKLNLIHEHNKHVGNGSYHFVIEIEVSKDEIPLAEKALIKFGKQVEQYLSFGPFEVLSN